MIGKTLTLALLLFTLPLPAQEPPSPVVPPASAVVPLSLGDATARALSNNNDIAIERESFHIVDASVLRADAPYDPAFRLDARYSNHTDPANSLLSGAPPGELSPSSEGYSGAASIGALLETGGTVSLSAAAGRDLTNNFLVLLSPEYTTYLGIEVRQPLLQNLSVDPARRGIRIAALDKERGTASLRRTVADTVAAVERAYWNLVAARRDVLVREASVRLAAEQRDDTKSRIDVGTLPETDIAQPLAELERRKGDLYASQEQMRRAEFLLKLLLLNDSNDPLWNQTLEPVDPPETAIVEVDLVEAMKGPRAAGPRSPRPRPRSPSATWSRLLREGSPEAAARPRGGLRAPGARGGAQPECPERRVSRGRPIVVPDAVAGRIRPLVRDDQRGAFSRTHRSGFLSPCRSSTAAAKGDSRSPRRREVQAEILLSQQKQRVAVEVRNAVLTLDTAAQRIDAAKAGSRRPRRSSPPRRSATASASRRISSSSRARTTSRWPFSPRPPR